MGYEIRDDEIAIVISPIDYDKPDKWRGDSNVSIAISPDHDLPDSVINGIVEIATMMSAFLDLSNEQPYLYDMVKEHRDYLMALDAGEIEEEKPVVIKKGNVYTLNKWTKTKGNA